MKLANLVDAVVFVMVLAKHGCAVVSSVLGNRVEAVSGNEKAADWNLCDSSSAAWIVF